MTSLKLGVVGAVGRGGSFCDVLSALGAKVGAVCDIRREELERARQALGADQAFTDFGHMLERARPDAVVIGTPMQLHVPMALEALHRDIHVLSEVTAGISMDECRALVAAASRSKAVYMMAENYCYTKANVFIRSLVAHGWFGEPYYAEGEYLHDVRDLGESTPWRRHWQLGIRGVTYCTHSLGPILQWLAGDRVTRVACEDSGSHHADPRGEPYASDSSVMLCKTEKGRLIKIRVDLVSERPHAMTNYQLQATDGAYESARAWGDSGKIWLRHNSSDPDWQNFEAWMGSEPAMELMPERWRRPPEAALRAGHDGGDYFVLEDFLGSCRGEIACPIGIHEAMDMTLPGLCSQESILKGGSWVEVPDSRVWIEAG
ncbi:MAG TPA: Gfo/Idh/MocA family oxidoreductase [Polyangiaceae bacterium]|jgi:predicted dehydrogenase